MFAITGNMRQIQEGTGFKFVWDSTDEVMIYGIDGYIIYGMDENIGKCCSCSTVISTGTEIMYGVWKYPLFMVEQDGSVSLYLDKYDLMMKELNGYNARCKKYLDIAIRYAGEEITLTDLITEAKKIDPVKYRMFVTSVDRMDYRLTIWTKPIRILQKFTLEGLDAVWENNKMRIIGASFKWNNSAIDKISVRFG